MRGKRLGVLALAVVLLARAEPARAADREAINGAIDRGVKRLRASQLQDGTWVHDQIGLTALCGLTLLECGVPVDDRAIQKAADAVRAASPGIDQTYSLALALLFLDRLGEPADVALIESLTVRLLAGQDAEGDWGYMCPKAPPEDQRRLQALIKQRQEHGPDKGGARPADEEKRTVKDLPREILLQLEKVRLQRAGAVPGGVLVNVTGDHSNTQFAVLGLWVARRHGLPVDGALLEADRHFRRTVSIDGGWSYTPMAREVANPAATFQMPGLASTPAMTCAGLLGIGAAYGAWNEAVMRTNTAGKGPGKTGRPAPAGGAKPQDPSKDKLIVNAVHLLGRWIDAMAQQGGGKVPQVNVANGRFYYFLWSLERIAVVFNVDRFGKTDWYDWGARVLLANQGPDGGWDNGSYPRGPDTCFALLFLQRANLAKDLSRALSSQMKEGLEAALQHGGIGGASLLQARKPFFDAPAGETRASISALDAQAAQLGKKLASATAVEQEDLLTKLRDGKGAAYTEALAGAIPNLEGDAFQKAREALAERLARMTSETLSLKLDDDNPEVRRAAALAVAVKEDKVHTAKLIDLLSDREPAVGRAAHAALKQLTGRDFGPAKDASSEQRTRATVAWKEWYRKQPQGGK